MRTTVVALAALALNAGAAAQVAGFVQLRQAQRTQSLDGCRLAACSTMVQEAMGELLLEQRFGHRLSGALRVEAVHDNALSDTRARVREGLLNWSPNGQLNVKLGRQVLTWGVSDYLYVNDIFPKNYDAFFTGGGFDRMKEPVDALHAARHIGGMDLEVVASRSKADRMPHPERFATMAMSAAAIESDGADERADAAIRLSANAGGWDVAGYAASFRSRERRYFVDGGGVRFDRPRLQHLGFSVTGNALGGLVWIEGAVRRAVQDRDNVVSRHFLGSSGKVIGGYSQQIGADLTASAQLQLEAATSRTRYRASLAPGVRPLKSIASTMHLRLHGRWKNQTVGGGAQVFVGSEGDTHFNPFVSWSPADGWTVEGGVNLFEGDPDTRYGAFKDDSNVYVLGRFSF